MIDLEHLNGIFDRFENFRKLMEIRALRRQHYYQRLSNHFYDKPGYSFDETIFEENEIESPRRSIT